MKASRKITFTIILLAGIVLFKTAYAQQATGTNFSVLLSGGSLGFQNEGSYVAITAVSGLWNSSDARIRLHTNGGEMRFTAANATQLGFNFNISQVKVSGDQSNDLRGISSGNTLTINQGDSVFILWNIVLEPWLPVMFILGMTGLVSLFGGSLYAVDRIKKKMYQEGLINGVIFVSIGFALFISWLWA